MKIADPTRIDRSRSRAPGRVNMTLHFDNLYRDQGSSGSGEGVRFMPARIMEEEG